MRRLLTILSLLFAIPSMATITVVDTIRATNQVNNGNTVTTGTLNIATANAIVVGVADYQLASLGTVTDNAGNTYTRVRTNTDGVSPRIALYVCLAPVVSSSMTFTYTGGGGTVAYPSIYVVGLHSTYPLVVDQQNGTGLSSATSGQPGSITPSQDNCIVFTACNSTGSFGVPAPPSVSSTYSTNIMRAPFVNLRNFAGGMAWNIQTTATATNPTWTYAGSFPSALLIVSLKEVAPAAANGAFLLRMLD
jgi:hypothetical protein